jgi:DDE superfamily endonuclease
VTAGQAVAFADEMRLGLHGRVRRVWAPRGVKVRQRVQLRYEWRYLALAVDPLAGTLRWRWLPNLRKEAVAAAASDWKADGLAAIVWDGAPGHRAKAVRAVAPALVTQPPASPELNPPERVFQELRRAAEGVVYPTLEEKVAAVERELTALAADAARLTRLTGWAWIADNLARLPAPNPAQS